MYGTFNITQGSLSTKISFPLNGKYFKTLSCTMLTVLDCMIHTARESINKLEQPNLFNGVEWNGTYVILTKRR